MIYTNIAAMQAAPIGGEADVLGYFAPGDGGGGRFWYDGTSTTTANDGTVFTSAVMGGRWRRIYSGPVLVDWFGGMASDATTAILAASVFPHVVFSNRSYRFNGQFNILAGQLLDLNRADIYHTDNTKTMFSAVSVDDWCINGSNAKIRGTRTDGTLTAEKGLYIESCNRYKVSDVQFEKFRNIGVHIGAGSQVTRLSDQGIFKGVSTNDSQCGLQVDAGTGAEYVEFIAHQAINNIIGAMVAAGNTKFTGGNLCENDIGVYLLGGHNNGHGIANGVNINHNGQDSIRAVGVTNGFSFDACHIYGGAGTGQIRISGGSTDIAFNGGVIDAPIVNDSGANRVMNAKLYSNYVVAGSVPGGWSSSNCF